MPDKPGALHSVAECLAAHDINLANTSGFVANNRAILVIEVEDPAQAGEILKRAGTSRSDTKGGAGRLVKPNSGGTPMNENNSHADQRLDGGHRRLVHQPDPRRALRLGGHCQGARASRLALDED